jgi:signal transduction histidine kinase
MLAPDAWAPRRLAMAALAWVALLAGSWWAASQRAEVDDARARRLAAAEVLEAGAERPLQAAPPVADWRAVTLPDNWDGRRPGYSGYVWYRLALPDGLASVAEPMLYLPAVAMNAEVWLNGRRLAGLGRMSAPLTRHFYTPLLFALPVALLQAEGNRLDLLVVGHPGYRCGLAPAWVGPQAALYNAWRWRSFWQNGGTLVTIVFNLAIGLYVLLLWWRARSHVAFGWFGAAVVVWGLRNLNYVLTDPPLPDLLFAELCVSGAAWFTALFAIFAERFCAEEDPTHRPLHGMRPFALGYAGVATLFFVAAPSYAQANAGFAALALIGIALTVWSQGRLMRLAWRQRRAELLAVALGALTYLVLLVNDFAIGIDKRSLGEVFIRQYAALPLFAAVTATLARRYLAALREARELSLTLQSRVEAQRAELARSFEALKQAERESARAQERTRLMGDLHDGLGLHLVTALRQARSPTAPREVVAATLQDCLDELRVAIDSLDETEREPVALLASLRYRLAPRFEALGLRLHWQVDADLPALTLDAEGALHLLRIVQEALGNALKHAGAREVRMAVLRAGEGVSISVADDGPGFDPARVRQGRGLPQMQQRAARLGARLEIGGGQGGGCTVRLQLPPEPRYLRP